MDGVRETFHLPDPLLEMPRLGLRPLGALGGSSWTCVASPNEHVPCVSLVDGAARWVSPVGLLPSPPLPQDLTLGSSVKVNRAFPSPGVASLGSSPRQLSLTHVRQGHWRWFTWLALLSLFPCETHSSQKPVDTPGLSWWSCGR